MIKRTGEKVMYRVLKQFPLYERENNAIKLKWQGSLARTIKIIYAELKYLFYRKLEDGLKNLQ